MFSKISFSFLFLFLLLFSIFLFSSKSTNASEIDPVEILHYVIDPQTTPLAFFLKDNKGQYFNTYKQLKKNLATEGKELIFAMNGGMYKKDYTPVGLYIENGQLITPIDRKENGYGNFYLQPNGIFYIDKDNSVAISSTANFKINSNIKYATQSGPMLIINGTIHSKFRAVSTNLNIRNGVGVLPNGHLVFAMSKGKINFYAFADFFKRMGCKNALYLDGFVSRTYLPSQNWIEDGHFGVIIGQIK